MIYGKTYGFGPRRCDRCDEANPKVADECYFCGEPGCDACMALEVDPEPGNTSHRLICGECVEKRKTEAVC